MIHLSVKNISDLWFGADTLLRQFKLKLNPTLWMACQKVALSFTPPSGAGHINLYRKVDKITFAEAVLQELRQNQILAESKLHTI